MMRQSLEHACKGPVGKALQGKKVGHGSSVFQESTLSGGQKVRQGSSTSGWDVGNPPTDEKHPGEDKSEQGEKSGPSSGRQEDAPTPSLQQKETSTRQYFHDKAREVEERIEKSKAGEGKK